MLTDGAGRAWAQAASTTTPALQLPIMLGLLAPNPNPFHSTSSIFGKIYLMCAVSDGSLAAQSDDSTILADLSNVQIFVQKVRGLLQLAYPSFCYLSNVIMYFIMLE